MPRLDSNSHIRTCLLLTFIAVTCGQHWWNFEDILQIHISPAFTPLPDKRFTHEVETGQFSDQINDVVVDIPKAGLGRYTGFSQWVDYDYTWATWPADKGRLVNVFLGIPYAAPPMGDDRFRITRPAYLDTRYTWYAKRFKPACLQPRTSTFDKKFNDFSEDCLYLNIFYPNRTWEASTTRYPVMVHIHGGSFKQGSSHHYPGQALASMGVVVVTFNYRLGPLGFLATGDFASLGNYGLWDQLQAMTWVRDNIWWFRGDPKQITIIGESAGGASVGLLLMSPASRGRDLFHQAIMMSGSDMSPWAVSDPIIIRPRHYAKELGTKLGCPTHDAYALVYCLRYFTDIEKLMNHSTEIQPLPGAPSEIWIPVVDGGVGFLPRIPKEERQQGRQQGVPVMMGVVHDEASFKAQFLLNKWKNWSLTEDFTSEMSKEAMREFLKSKKVLRLEETLEEVFMRYTWWSNPNNLTARKEEFVSMLSDYYINAPVDATLRSQSEKTENAYFYEFAYRSPNDTAPRDFGIYHGIEIPFLFGFPFMNKSWWSNLTYPHPPPTVANRVWNYPFDTNMSEFTMMLWTNFARLGNPTPWEIQNVTWLPYTPEVQNYMHIYINSSIRQEFRQSHLAFWRERFDAVGEPQPAIDRYIYYPVLDVQIATYVLACLLVLVIIGIILLVVFLRKRPDPDDFRREGGDQFSTAFRDTFAGYGMETDV